MQITSVRLEIPEGANVILGTSHFIKTVEDIYEALVNTVPQMKFGIAFNEASGPCLTRSDGNDEALQAAAVRNAAAVGAGHSFVVVMKDGYPINVASVTLHSNSGTGYTTSKLTREVSRLCSLSPIYGPDCILFPRS